MTSYSWTLNAYRLGSVAQVFAPLPEVAASWWLFGQAYPRTDGFGWEDGSVVRLRADEFDQIVEDALARIPRRFRRRMHNVALVVEAEPPNPNLLGLYRGRPLPERSVFEAFAMPDQIIIYQATHERLARDRAELERMVRDTVWHEIAHYFGMNESRVREAERRRRHERQG